MRNAETILGLIRDRGRRGLPLERVYRLLFNRDLYLLAYGKHRPQPRGADAGRDAGDRRWDEPGEDRRHHRGARYERYRWTPCGGRYIPKKTGRQRPLGLPTWSDKLLQEVLRLILDAYYEPQFSDHSHGFRPGRGCHTALGRSTAPGRARRGSSRAILRVLRPTGSPGPARHPGASASTTAASCGSIDGAAQGGISGGLEVQRHAEWRAARRGGQPPPREHLPRPLDQFVETTLLPAYNRGRRRPNPTYEPYHRATYLRRTGRRRRPDGSATRRSDCRRSTRPTRTIAGSRFVRYADDLLLGFNGPRGEAEAIKQALGAFLRDTLKLDLPSQNPAHACADRDGAIPGLRDHRPGRGHGARPAPTGVRPTARSACASRRTSFARSVAPTSAAASPLPGPNASTMPRSASWCSSSRRTGVWRRTISWPTTGLGSTCCATPWSGAWSEHWAINCA